MHNMICVSAVTRSIVTFHKLMENISITIHSRCSILCFKSCLVSGYWRNL